MPRSSLGYVMGGFTVCLAGIIQSFRGCSVDVSAKAVE